MRDFKNYFVWQQAHEFSLSAYRATASFPSSERFGLQSQLRRAAVSIEANIAEGTARRSTADFVRFLDISRSSAAEVECLLLLARDLGYLHPQVFASLSSSVASLRKMLTSLMRKLVG